MANANRTSKLGALLVLLRAFRASREPERLGVAAERVSRPAVKVTSDFGVSSAFPGIR
jgi:hypothetical protein